MSTRNGLSGASVSNRPAELNGCTHRQTQPSTRFQDASRLLDGLRGFIDVLQRHERDHQVEAAISERRSRRVREAYRDLGSRTTRRLEHRWRNIEPDDPMPHPREVARE